MNFFFQVFSIKFFRKSIKQKVSRWDKLSDINNHNEMKSFIKNQLEIQFMSNASLNENNFANFFGKLSDKVVT